MAIPPWTVELLRRGLNDVARRAREPETLEKLKTQASEIIHDLPQTAARGLDAVMRATEKGKNNVQRWTQKQTALTIPLINASGTLTTPLGTGVPIAGDAVEAAYACLIGDIRNDHSFDDRLQRALHRRLPDSDDLQIAVTTHFQAALVAIVLGMNQEDILIHRSQAIRLRKGGSLVDAMNALVPIVQEVGANDGIDASDFDPFDSFCLIQADNELQPNAPDPISFSGKEVKQVLVLPVATLLKSKDSTMPSIESAIESGMDIVVVDGGGVFGGPECGIIVGRKKLVESITASALFQSLEASSATHAIVLHLLQQSSDASPIDALIETSEDNLRARAERMATRLSASDSVKSCRVTNDEARVTPKGRWRYPSRQIRVEHQSKSGSEWAESLKQGFPALLVNVGNEPAGRGAIVIDLKWINPANDSIIAEIIGGVSDTSQA